MGHRHSDGQTILCGLLVWFYLRVLNWQAFCYATWLPAISMTQLNSRARFTAIRCEYQLTCRCPKKSRRIELRFVVYYFYTGSELKSYFLLRLALIIRFVWLSRQSFFKQSRTNKRYNIPQSLVSVLHHIVYLFWFFDSATNCHNYSYWNVQQ